jgi:hypothetical protein
MIAGMSEDLTPRQLGHRRATKTREARSDRYAYVTLILDRETSDIEIEHPWLSAPEAVGILVIAEQRYRERIVNKGLDSDDDS